MCAFAAIVPVGPREEEVRNLRELVQSLTYYEDHLGWLVLIDDTATGRHLERSVEGKDSCQVVALLNPRLGHGNGHRGGLFVGVLAALEWLAANAKADYTLKLDTDSLVIRPFSNSVRNLLQQTSDIGIAGVIGATCNRSREYYGDEVRMESPLVVALREWQWYRSGSKRLPSHGVSGQVWLAQLELDAFGRIRSHVEAAVKNGYRTLRYCQGGAYVLSSRMLTRMSEKNYFRTGLAWAHMPFGEDVIMGMYAYAANLKLYDESEKGRIFGLQWRSLPFPPDEMVAKGFSIVHSVRGDQHRSEREVRDFFASLRELG